MEERGYVRCGKCGYHFHRTGKCQICAGRADPPKRREEAPAPKGK